MVLLVNVSMVAPSKHFDIRRLVSSWADGSSFDIVRIVCVHRVLNPPLASNTTVSVHSSTRTPGSSRIDIAVHKRLVSYQAGHGIRQGIGSVKGVSYRVMDSANYITFRQRLVAKWHRTFGLSSIYAKVQNKYGVVFRSPVR